MGNPRFSTSSVPWFNPRGTLNWQIEKWDEPRFAINWDDLSAEKPPYHWRVTPYNPDVLRRRIQKDTADMHEQRQSVLLRAENPEFSCSPESRATIPVKASKVLRRVPEMGVPGNHPF